MKVCLFIDNFGVNPIPLTYEDALEKIRTDC